MSILYRISKDGELVKNTIVKSSGNKEFDEIALKAIKSSAPFKKLPESYKENYLDMKLKFDYNVYPEKFSNR